MKANASNSFATQALIAEFAVEAFHDTFCQALPGSINAVPMPCATIRPSLDCHRAGAMGRDKRIIGDQGSRSRAAS
jgi:hypothetical protein